MTDRDDDGATAEREIAESLANAHDENGVDRSLIRWFLTLTPAERIAYNQGVIDLVAAARPWSDGAR